MFATLFSQNQQIIPSSAEVHGLSSVREDGNKKYGKIQDGLESSIGIEGRSRITRILGEVHSLTDVEKLLLYLKLPTGAVNEDQNRLTPTSCLPTSNRKEQGEAFTWIKSHLEEHGDVCMPKAEVYDEYRQYCEQHELRPLCNADFGKMMKQVFPDINTRRLGQRGQSKYFYGGLRKKLEHAPPTLPELEITAKNIEIDSNTMDSEIFKSSCQLVCEWADKLLDMKFTGVQEIAEHLIVNTFVNTKSVAAFTLIAAMQESGKHNLKDSALFSTQPSASGDKHKETNLLLQRKLQQNKEIQKQKEKAQALREEIKQQIGSHGNRSQSKTPVSSLRIASSSSSVSVSLKTPRCQSTSSSLNTSQSPQVFQSPKKPVSPWLQQKTSECEGQQILTGCQSNSLGKGTSLFVLQEGVTQSTDRQLESVSKSKLETEVINHSDKQDLKNISRNQLSETFVDKNKLSQEKKVNAKELNGYKLMDTDYDYISNEKCENETNIGEAKTPESCMETDQSELSHVRKIDFDDLVSQSVNKKTDSKAKTSVAKEGKGSCAQLDTVEVSAEKLSKSTGYLSLKKMLENKSEDQSGLNKSLGYLGKSKNALFVNQSAIPGKSAFVPFSQVQSLCRKEGTGGSQSVAMAIPVIIPSVAQTQSSQTVSQSANITMIALPADLQRSPTKNSSEAIQNETFFNILPASAVFQQPNTTEMKLQSSVVESSLPSINIQTQTKESTSVVTVSSVLSKMVGSDCSVTSAQSMQNLPKQMRTKFTPIRPKASPNKTPPQKESKTEVPAYDKDKRPVSAILKEKRAKEQAEAIAKFQSSIRLPAIPLQQNISFPGNQVSTLQGVQAASSNVPANEVVIIVNNQPVKLQQVIGQNPVINSPSVRTKQVTSSESHAEQQAVSKGKNITDKENHSAADSSKSDEKSQWQVMSPETPDSDSKNRTVSTADKNDLLDMKEISPMIGDGDVTPILCEEEENSVNYYEDNANLKGRNIENQMRDQSDNKKENISSEIVDQMWSETPRKIQKLNITSPFQEDSAVVFGHETPVRVSKTTDLGRPESACSYGRETPSGTRKRKSSDLHSRRNFKRLNSTGEENEDFHNLSLVLSPDSDLSVGLNPRRTHSCTYELDRDSKAMINYNQHQQQQKLNSVGGSLMQGLQSPDIHSLEQEALIESFPNSLYAMKPQHKSHRNQSSSVGVSAKTLRQSQQKLIKQQHDLDERVKNFLQTQTEVDQKANIESVTRTADQQRSSQLSPGSRSSLRADALVVTDRGKPYQRPSSVATVGNKVSSLETEPSGLPSEVADWINETIEKRQKENQSVMSEPEFRQYQSVKGDRNPKLQNFRFEVSHAAKSEKTAVTTEAHGEIIQEKFESRKFQQSSNDDNNFTVPKAPPVSNLRTKDTLRLNTDIPSVSQRCQSLPIFQSPIQSPVSPLVQPGSRTHIGQRASSMSPRGQIPEHGGEMTSPVSRGLQSPVRRKDMRDGQTLPAAQNGVLTALGHRDSKQGTYLASIQHSLQKPVDVTHEVLSPQDSSLGKQPLFGINTGGKCQNTFQNRSRESSLETDERFVSKTPFSDSGYHSSGPSPILNSTPVSALEGSEPAYVQGRNNMKHKQYITESPITMVTDFTSPVQQLSPQQSPNKPQLTTHQQNVAIATNQLNNNSMNPNQLRSSIHSAFIPIQGSHHDVRYVTPIKPTVTLPDTGVNQTPVSVSIENSSDLFIDSSQDVLGSDITMVSPRAANPPSYEVAIKHLKKSTSQPATVSQSKSSEMLTSLDVTKEQIPHYDLQASLLANLGSHNSPDNLGPFAQKLIKLSLQTQNGGKDIQALLRNELSSSNNPVSVGTINTQNQFIPAGSDLSNMPHTVNNCQSNITSADINHSGANLDFNFTGEVNIYADNHLVSEQRQAILKPNSAIKSVLTKSFPEHSMLITNTISDSVLNVSPSHHQSSHLKSTSQTDSHMMSSLHNHDSASLNFTENRQLLNKPNFSFQRDLNETEKLHLTNREMSLLSDGAFNRNENTGAIRSLLIGGKLSSQDLEMVVDSEQSKQEEVTQQELMDDIGLPWESLREIEGDLEDFNMFN